METLFRICSNSLFYSVQNHQNQTFLRIPTLTSVPFSSKSNSQNWVSLKPQNFDYLQPFVVSKTRVFACVNSVERLAMSSDEKESSKSDIRKKNLAVFVSGGGSNFRAVHQAILSGDVNGQFVVLVTNKQGKL